MKTLKKQPPVVSYKKSVLKYSQIHRKTPVIKPLFG